MNSNFNTSNNGQWGFDGTQALKAVRSVRQIISKVHVIIGGVFFGVGLFVFVLGFFFGHGTAALVLWIVGGTFVLAGVIELIIAVFFRRSVRKQLSNLERLKAEGIQYSAEITAIVPQLGVRIGRSFSVYAECTYVDREGKTNLVKSHSFLYEHANRNLPFNHMTHTITPQKDRHSAWVYVSSHDSHDYEVEIFTMA